eukprot:CAMPEP_0198666262 /NCGR_PEP_ID=MMETSP1467-20131203/63980_1 /TAXON_ID=1462469 /ORGANISM="unid. sp., Strain CCMP2135" /LENGTH=294 /DNA_ID=CAMNT_0044402901 /DNA_START=44 /DNA_END=924 /DNA_ORIENTATION=+
MMDGRSSTIAVIAMSSSPFRWRITAPLCCFCRWRTTTDDRRRVSNSLSSAGAAVGGGDGLVDAGLAEAVGFVVLAGVDEEEERGAEVVCDAGVSGGDVVDFEVVEVGDGREGIELGGQRRAPEVGDAVLGVEPLGEAEAGDADGVAHDGDGGLGGALTVGVPEAVPRFEAARILRDGKVSPRRREETSALDLRSRRRQACQVGERAVEVDEVGEVLCLAARRETRCADDERDARRVLEQRVLRPGILFAEVEAVVRRQHDDVVSVCGFGEDAADERVHEAHAREVAASELCHRV